MQWAADGGVFAGQGRVWEDGGVWLVEACGAVVVHEFVAGVGDGEGVHWCYEGEEGGGAEGRVRCISAITPVDGWIWEEQDLRMA